MSLFFYKVAHIFGIALVLVALGGACVAVLNGITKENNRAKALIAATHGLGVLLIVVAGFGMLAKLGLGSPATWQGWVWAKIGIWVVLAAALVVQKRKGGLARLVWWLVPLLVLGAAYLAFYKPF